jgi:hypothetical protein
MPLTILYIGRDADITVVMNRLLNAREEWTGICVCSDEEAISICKEKQLDLVLLGNGINQEAEQELREKLLALRPGLKIVQHYGGGSGLLYGEVMSALNT